MDKRAQTTHTNTPQTAANLTSPVGEYQAELLMLAPAGGEDPHTHSLLAQLLSLGVAVELDENWQLPVTPPRDLSHYKACIFPESARTEYDADLTAFARAGGHTTYLRYYTQEPATNPDRSAHAREGHDSWFFNLANLLLQGDLTRDHADFARTLERRSVAGMVADYRAQVVAWTSARPLSGWPSFSDPACTYLLGNAHLAQSLQDEEWSALMDYPLEMLAAATPDALQGRYSLADGIVTTGIGMVASTLMAAGHARDRSDFCEAGMALMRYFLDDSIRIRGAVSARYMRFLSSETIQMATGIYWLARLSGESRYTELADSLVQTVTTHLHADNGLWHHAMMADGSKAAHWSRGTLWPVLFLVECLDALDPASESAARIRSTLQRSFAGLQAVQHPDWGLWHLVLDEPHTRLESSASAGLVYSHDRLRALGVLDDRYSEMAERAFLGLKRLHYRGGVASNCRGTSTGTPEYYRTRPMGYATRTLFPATLATRTSPG